jgi:ketol-acid reductoisomerase
MAKEIGIVGFGNQGRPWALNLRDSGWEVRVFGRAAGSSSGKAGQDGFSVENLEGIGSARALALLIPDDAMPAFYARHGEHLKAGQTLIFAHGYNLHYRTVPWSRDYDWTLVAPKGIGAAVRERFVAGSGVPAVLAVEHDATGRAWDVVRDVAEGLGATRAGVYRASAREEVESDLFSEQALLCGGLPALIAETYDVLVEHGISPEVAYLECVHELAFITDLVQKNGIHGTLQMISPTARFGGLQGAPRVISPAVRKELEAMFQDIRRGSFARRLAAEQESGFSSTKKAMDRWNESSVECVGRSVRRRMAGPEGSSS